MRKAIQFVLIVIFVTGLTNFVFAKGQSVSRRSDVQLILTNAKQGFFKNLLDQVSWGASARIDLDYSNNRIVYSGGNAQSNEKIIHELISVFTQRTHRRVDTSLLDYSKAIDLTELLTFLSGRVPLFEGYVLSGVNCHATSLVAAGILKNVTHVDSSEFEFLIEKDCRPIDPLKNQKESSQKIIGFQNRGTLFSHSFYVISPHVLLQKRSLETEKKFRFLVVEKLPSAEYFSCQKSIQTCDDENFVGVQKQVDEIDAYYLSLMRNFQNANERDQISKEIEGILEIVDLLPDNPACVSDVARMKERLKSLQVLSDQLDGVGAYANQHGFGRRD